MGVTVACASPLLLMDGGSVVVWLLDVYHCPMCYSEPSQDSPNIDKLTDTNSTCSIHKFCIFFNKIFMKCFTSVQFGYSR